MESGSAAYSVFQSRAGTNHLGKIQDNTTLRKRMGILTDTNLQSEVWGLNVGESGHPDSQ